VLATSAAVPLLVALAACAGPDPLDGPPPLSHDVRALLAAIGAERNLVTTYARTLASYSALAPVLSPLLGEHRAHLAQLRARLTVPPGASPAAAASLARPGRPAAIPATGRAAVAQLRDAEQAASAAQLSRVVTVGGSLAQLFASIAASEATHVTALDERGPA